MSKERLEAAKLMAKMLRLETRLPYDFPFDLVDWLVEQAERVQFLEMRWELLKLELEQSESLNAHFKNDEAVDTIHDIQNLMSKMESGVYYKEFHE